VSDDLHRDKSRAAIAGVCAGLAQYFGVNPAWLRVIFVLLALSGGPAIPAYIILWIILPAKGSVGLSQEQTVQANLREIRTEARGLVQELQAILGQGPARPGPSKRTLWLGVALLVAGVASLANHLQWLGWFQPERLWPLALILAGFVLVNRALRHLSP